MKKCPEKISNTITKKDEIKIGKDETEWKLDNMPRRNPENQVWRQVLDEGRVVVSGGELMFKYLDCKLKKKNDFKGSPFLRYLYIWIMEKDHFVCLFSCENWWTCWLI